MLGNVNKAYTQLKKESKIVYMILNCNTIICHNPLSVKTSIYAFNATSKHKRNVCQSPRPNVKNFWALI